MVCKLYFTLRDFFSISNIRTKCLHSFSRLFYLVSSRLHISKESWVEIECYLIPGVLSSFGNMQLCIFRTQLQCWKCCLWQLQQAFLKAASLHSLKLLLNFLSTVWWVILFFKDLSRVHIHLNCKKYCYFWIHWAVKEFKRLHCFPRPTAKTPS